MNHYGEVMKRVEQIDSESVFSYKAGGIALIIVLVGLSIFASFGAGFAQLSDDEFESLQKQGQEEGWTFTISKKAGGNFPDPQLTPMPRPTDGQLKNAIFDPCTPRQPFPASFDWRDSSACTPIRDMYYGNVFCASCWSFGVLAAVESQIAIHDGVHVDLSEQWLVSCTGAGDCSWWNGWYGNCWNWLTYNGQTDPCGDFGAVLEDDFPYRAIDLPCQCPYNHPYWVDSWAFVGPEFGIPTVDQIKQALLDHGPVAGAIVWDSAFRYYSGGIFNTCSPSGINHTITIVGWDDNQGTNGIWIIRNELGTEWGEQGYMRIEYGCSSVGYAATYCTYTPHTGMWTSPSTDLLSEGPTGGPFSPANKDYHIKNLNDAGIQYSVSTAATWLTITNGSGYLSADDSVTVNVAINSNANGFPTGQYQATVNFVNETNHNGDTSRDVILTVGMGVVYEWTMDTNPGWTTQGQWAYGYPTGGGGAWGEPDPTSGYTGQNVYGYNLNGDYANNLPEYHLTTGAINCTGLTNVHLRFWRYLNVEQPAYDHAYVRVSNDGSIWTTVWQNTSEITDIQWQEMELDISAVANNQPAVYLRWTMGTTDGSWVYSGWNIDDVRIAAVDLTPPLSIEMIPNNPPIQVVRGGSFAFTGIITNNTNQPQLTDVWIMVNVPGYGMFGPLSHFDNIELLPYQTRTAPNIDQDVPTYAPLGAYGYISYCGNFPDIKIDSSSFEFTVIQGALGNAVGWSLGDWFSQNDSGLPTKTELYGNYPNPFNATTSFNYALREEANVTLEVYNLLGQKVATVVNEHQAPGYKTIRWDAAQFSSGIYFYKLGLGDEIYAKRMTLLK